MLMDFLDAIEELVKEEFSDKLRSILFAFNIIILKEKLKNLN